MKNPIKLDDIEHAVDQTDKIYCYKAAVRILYGTLLSLTRVPYGFTAGKPYTGTHGVLPEPRVYITAGRASSKQHTPGSLPRSLAASRSTLSTPFVSLRALLTGL